jgi:hypothetical protein
MRCASARMYTKAAQLDEEEDVEPLQPQRLHRKSLYQNLNGQGGPISGREGDRPTPALKKPLAVAREVNASAASRG